MNKSLQALLRQLKHLAHKPTIKNQLQSFGLTADKLKEKSRGF